MKYQGSKARHAKEILAVIDPYRKEGQLWVEPFVGGANMIDKVKGPRIGNDKHFHLIEMWKALQGGWVPPEEVSEEEYNNIHYNQECYSAAEIGYTGFNLSYSGKWWSGYARDGQGKRNYGAEAYRNIMAQVPNLTDVFFTNYDYKSLPIPTGSLCYCLPPNAKIKTIDEKFKEIKDIQINDVLHGGRRVLNKMSKIYRGNLLSLKIQGLIDKIEVTPEHRIISIPGRNIEKRQDFRTNEDLWSMKKATRASDLKIGDYVLIPLGGIENPVDLEINKEYYSPFIQKYPILNICSELFRFFGYYLAEGHSQFANGIPNSILLSFCMDELDTWVADACHCIKTAFGVEAIVKEMPWQSVAQVRLHSTVAAKFLYDYITGTAHFKALNDNILTFPINYQIEILKGWLRGDGGLEIYERNRAKLCGSTVSPKLAEQMYTIALRCGLKPSIKRRAGRIFDIYFASEDIIKLGYEVPAIKFRSSRRIINNHILTRIRGINEIPYEGEVFDLDVDKDDLFNVSNILVHNCDPPYRGTTPYKGGFNSDEFWEWTRKVACKANVFVSEYVAPSDFKCVWEKRVTSSLTKDTGSKEGIERLFIYDN